MSSAALLECTEEATRQCYHQQADRIMARCVASGAYRADTKTYHLPAAVFKLLHNAPAASAASTPTSSPSVRTPEPKVQSPPLTPTAPQLTPHAPSPPVPNAKPWSQVESKCGAPETVLEEVVPECQANEEEIGDSEEESCADDDDDEEEEEGKPHAATLPADAKDVDEFTRLMRDTANTVRIVETQETQETQKAIAEVCNSVVGAAIQAFRFQQPLMRPWVQVVRIA